MNFPAVASDRSECGGDQGDDPEPRHGDAWIIYSVSAEYFESCQHQVQRQNLGLWKRNKGHACSIRSWSAMSGSHAGRFSQRALWRSSRSLLPAVWTLPQVRPNRRCTTSSRRLSWPTSLRTGACANRRSRSGNTSKQFTFYLNRVIKGSILQPLRSSWRLGVFCSVSQSPVSGSPMQSWLQPPHTQC